MPRSLLHSKKSLAFTDILRGMQICVLEVGSTRDFLLEPPFMLMLVLKRMCQYLECISPIIFWKIVDGEIADKFVAWKASSLFFILLLLIQFFQHLYSGFRKQGNLSSNAQ